MVEARDEDQHALALVSGPHRPAHIERRSDIGEALTKRVEVVRAVHPVENDAHEEIAGLGIVELLGVENVEAAFEQGRRDPRDNAGAIGAGQGQDMTQSGHQAPRRVNRTIGA